MGRTLRETVVAGGVIYPAGTPESEIDGKVTADVWEGKATAADPDPEPTGYAALNKGQLEAEVEKRNTDRADDAKIEVTGTGANGNVVVKDLVAALEADDQANAGS